MSNPIFGSNSNGSPLNVPQSSYSSSGESGLNKNEKIKMDSIMEQFFNKGYNPGDLCLFQDEEEIRKIFNEETKFFLRVREKYFDRRCDHSFQHREHIDKFYIDSPGKFTPSQWCELVFCSTVDGKKFNVISGCFE